MSKNGLLTTVCYKIGDNKPIYALEGSVAVTGSLVQWLRDNLGVISTADETEDLATSLEDNGDCYLVPAFSGLLAPRWNRLVWRTMRALSGLAGRRRGTMLSFAGPVIVVLLIGFWATGLTIGAALVIQPELGTAIRPSSGEAWSWMLKPPCLFAKATPISVQ